MGSKSRIAKYIVPIIQKYISENKITQYYEPFVGGANIIDKIECDNKIGSDLNPYLIALLNHVKSGGKLYSNVPKPLYDEARDVFMQRNKLSEFEDWQIGCIGFLASYNGRWFDGGYAKPGYEKTKNGERYRDYYREASENLMKQASRLREIKFYVEDYKRMKPSGAVVYCDPPYLDRKKYANATKFDYNEFWNVMREWSKNNIVIVSEQTAPDDFKCIWEQNVNRTINAKNKEKAIEKLFVMR